LDSASAGGDDAASVFPEDACSEMLDHLNSEINNVENRGPFAMVRSTRQELEDFILTDSNKISTNAIKFILDKWTIFETKLNEEIAEKEKWKAIAENTTQKTHTYVLIVKRKSLETDSRTCNRKKTNQ